jgi:hypothetical protein
MTAIRTLDERLLAGLVPGTWAAISSDQTALIAIGNTLEETLHEAQKLGEKEPFIVRVPLENSALIF